VERVPEMLDFYGTDTILLLGGSLLEARDRLTEATLAFTEAVARHAASMGFEANVAIATPRIKARTRTRIMVSSKSG